MSIPVAPPVTGLHARWHAVMTLFGEAMDAAPEEREQLLQQHMVIDREVAEEVRSLLASSDSIGERFARPALALLGEDASEWLTPSVASLEGQQVGAYAVRQKIGEGGMGAVYAAVRVSDTFRQRVALKTISRGADSRAIVQRFQRERRILAGLQHPNIATMFDGGVTDAGTPYFVMEFVDGFAIDVWCARHALGVAQRLDLFMQICGAVQHAHRRLVVHRDIKPGNIMVSSDGVVKLLDFGIAKLVADDTDGSAGESSVTHDGLTPHTTAYASPEQVRGEAVSTATDVYSLGVVLYQLLAGVPPFQSTGRTPAQLLTAVADEIPAPPSAACTDDAAVNCGLDSRARLSKELAGELDAIVLMAMRKEPERRYVSAEALAEDVHRYLKGLPVAARPDTRLYRLRKFVERQRGLVIMGVTTFLAIVSFIGYALWQANAMRREAERTTHISNFMQSVLGTADLTRVGGSLPHVGPQAKVGTLFDSALVQVPLEFPDDPAVRARLYRTLGSGLMSQSRMREAFNVLDSAIVLSKQAYGASSAEFALASNEAGTAALHSNRLAKAESLSMDAQRALEHTSRTNTELYAQTFSNLASVALVRGEYRAMDSLAGRALALESQRTSAPSMTKAMAMNRLASGLAMHNKTRGADSLYRQALAVLDAMRASNSLEYIDVLGNLVGASLELNQVAAADSFARVGERLAAEGFGPDSREYALMLASRSLLRNVAGDTAQARALSLRAEHIVDSIPEVVAPVRVLVRFTQAIYYIGLGQWPEADNQLKRALNDLSGVTRGYHLQKVLLYRGIANAMMRDFKTSEEQLLASERVFNQSEIDRPGDLRLLRQSLAAMYTRTGRPTEAAKYFAFLPAEQVNGIKVFAAREHRADSIAMARAAAPTPLPR